MKWYFPTHHGDIRLEKIDSNRTKVIVQHLTPSEQEALKKLREAALGKGMFKHPFGTEDIFAFLEKPALIDDKKGYEFELTAGLSRIQKILADSLTPERDKLNAVVFKDNTIEELAADAVEKRSKEKGAAAKAGTSVKKPTQGCPAPDFPHIQHRANVVLESFLTPEQVEDWRRFNRFVTHGADTGHRYMLISRDRRDELGNFSGRSVYDLDEQRSYCVHDWTVPAPEELLSLHLFLSLPGRESYIRAIPEN